MKTHLKSKFQSTWYLWVFPLCALGISAWLLYTYYHDQGPRIYIYFDDAGNIRNEKSTVRYRGVPIGTVKDLYISDDQKDVVAEVLLRKDAASFAVEGSKFSLVTPKVGLQGVSGLETLFEGSYIAVLPGKPDGAAKTEFKAQANTSVDPLDDTSGYLIESDSAESINQGSAVTYRGFNIGTVSKINVAKGGQKVTIQINVENRYTWLIRANTIFWRKVGVQAKLGLFGSQFKVNSIESIMSGGVELATPSPAGPTAKAFQKFQLAVEAPKNWAKWNTVLE